MDGRIHLIVRVAQSVEYSSYERMVVSSILTMNIFILIIL